MCVVHIGKNALTFFDHDADDFDPGTFLEKYTELPITFDQARQSLVRAEEYEDDPEYGDIGFHVEVDLPARGGEKSAE